MLFVSDIVLNFLMNKVLTDPVANATIELQNDCIYIDHFLIEARMKSMAAGPTRIFSSAITRQTAAGPSG
jgi:hypothetical protein